MIDSFTYFVGVMFFACIVWLPILLVLTLITPRKLLKKYFKEPHFNSGELIVFGSFPGFLIRTSIFCRFYLTPKAVEGRKLNGFVEDSPQWYKISVLIIVLGSVAHFIFAFVSMAIIYTFKL